MKPSSLIALASFLLLAACGGPGDVGDECFDDGDCVEGLTCHVHAHDDDDEAHDDEAAGLCEDEAGEHDHDDEM